MGKYKRKTQRGSFTKDALNAALKAIINESSGIREAGRRFEIPESTLRRHLKIRNNLRELKSQSLGRAPVFTRIQEQELATHVVKLGKLFFGLTTVELRSIAYNYAEANNMKNNFNKEKKLAGKDWYAGFIQRHPEISLRKPEATSINRIMAFNKAEVDRFFVNLENVMSRYHFNSDRIFNVDETGISTVPKENSKRLGPKGIKQFGVVSSWERGKNVTVICAVSASGIYIPPLFIFPRKRMSPVLEKNGPREAVYTCTKNGWSNEAIFMQWLKHFQKKVASNEENPVLLILDNHCSHISLQIYEFCRANFIVMVSIPPHTSHRLQPLDITFYGPLKRAFSKHCNLFLKTKINSAENDFKLSHYDLAEVFNSAYCDTANMEKAISGFRSAGIYPLHPEKFSEDDFAAADHLLNHEEGDVENIRQREGMNTPIQDDFEQGKQTTSMQRNADPSSPQPSCSGLQHVLRNRSPNRLFYVSVENISPVPIPRKRKEQKKNSRAKQHSEVLTATPLKTKLEERELNKISKKNPQVKSTRKKVVKKQVFIESDSEEDVNEKDLCDDDELDDIEDDEAESNFCNICGEFGKSGEVWYRCISCGDWSHKECSGHSSPKDYICDFCRP